MLREFVRKPSPTATDLSLRSIRSQPIAKPNNGNSTATGFNLGGGIERKITRNISVGLEYLYTDLKDDEFRVRLSSGSATPATNPFILGNPRGTDFARSDDRFRYHAARATIAYRF